MLTDPVILFFVLGLGAGLARSELRLPGAVYDLITMVLLLSIGMKGGWNSHASHCCPCCRRWRR